MCWSYKVSTFMGLVLLLCSFLASVVIMIMDDSNVRVCCYELIKFENSRLTSFKFED